MSAYDRLYDTLTCHWPVERLDGVRLEEDVEACIAKGWLYRLPIGHGWVRIGLTSEGRRQVEAFVTEVQS